jgi:hypothetical protein
MSSDSLDGSRKSGSPALSFLLFQGACFFFSAWNRCFLLSGRQLGIPLGRSSSPRIECVGGFLAIRRISWSAPALLLLLLLLLTNFSALLRAADRGTSLAVWCCVLKCALFRVHVPPIRAVRASPKDQNRFRHR